MSLYRRLLGLRSAVRLLLLLAWIALPALPALAEEGPRAKWQKEREAVVSRLEEHAAWCHDEDLRAERNRTYEGLLVLRADHPRARRMLKYKQDKSGAWKRGKYRAPKPSEDTKKAAEAATRHKLALAPLRAAVTALRDHDDAEMHDLERAVDELAQLLGDDEEVRDWNGEVLLGKRWVLAETETALESGKALRAEVRRLVKEEPPSKRIKPTNEEFPFLRSFAAGAQNARVRLLAMKGSVPAESTARLIASAWPVYNAVIGKRPKTTISLRLFVYPDKETGISALANHPGVTAKDLKRARSLASYWGPKSSDLFVWTKTEAHRVESSLRQAMQVHVRHSLRVSTDRGWAWEGFGHWFTEHMLGTHYTRYVQEDRYAKPSSSSLDRARRLRDANADWFEIGAELAASKEWPDLRILMGRNVNTLTGDDVLASYLLACFLIEGRPSVVHDLLIDVGANKSPDAWCAKHLGWSIHELDRRLRRWVAEMKSAR